MKIYSFEKLIVRKESLSLTKDIYGITSKFPVEEKFGLVSQFRRSAVSVASNLAEGTSRKTNKDKAHFTTMYFKFNNGIIKSSDYFERIRLYFKKGL